jgi:hypothetical protein
LNDGLRRLGGRKRLNEIYMRGRVREAALSRELNREARAKHFVSLAESAVNDFIAF